MRPGLSPPLPRNAPPLCLTSPPPKAPLPVPGALATCEQAQLSRLGEERQGGYFAASLPQGPRHKLPSICRGPGWEIKHWAQ